jgi:alkanesulfonate monooxygenase SsuD/methylene tetrahydromethanopterin reductase-like flavin-dependent oxidoreductase (luciferase family)
VGRIGGSGGVGREEREDTAAEFFGFKTVGGGVEGARNDPKLFGAAGGGVDHLRVAAGQGDILLVANEEDGKRAGGDAFLR